MQETMKMRHANKGARREGHGQSSAWASPNPLDGCTRSSLVTLSTPKLLLRALLYSAKEKWKRDLSQLAFVQCGRASLGGLPNHAGLGSETNRSLSKTFWNDILSSTAGLFSAARRRAEVVAVLPIRCPKGGDVNAVHLRLVEAPLAKCTRSDDRKMIETARSRFLASVVVVAVVVVRRVWRSEGAVLGARL